MLDPYRPKAPSQEIAFLDCVRRLGKSRAGRIGVIVHLSHLAPSLKRWSFYRIATETFIECISSFSGQFFRLYNDDIVFLASGATLEQLDNAVNRIRVLFSGDPLAQFDTYGQGVKEFCTWYDLRKDYDKLLKDATGILSQAEEFVKRQKDGASPSEDAAIAPIRPELLVRLEDTLAKADLTNVVRRQTVCGLFEDQPPEPLFDETFVSIEELQKTAIPGIDLLSDRWLFRYLTGTLDKRVMSVLMRDGVRASRPFSLNLNVATVLSPEFSRFEASIIPQLRGRLVVEMNKIDVFADMGAFLFARDYLHNRGFRICLDGLTHHTLPYYDRERLGFDLIKIYWTPGSIDEMKDSMIPSVRSIVMEAGQSRTILCRCESAKAIAIGQSLGIVMFQGRYVEALLNRQAS